MEVMEEGNLMDRVPILLQRDMQYYQQHQSVLQERICPGVVGGKLDFPRYASFASIKIVYWWEDEYFAAYKKHSGLLNTNLINSNDDNITKNNDSGTSGVIVKNSDPEKFVCLVTKSADQLLEHLHCLSQESLDHADLTVLTATIGAAALIKNCLSVYLQCVTTNIYRPRGEDKGGALKISYKQFSEMTEALAERLLDLHCRLLLLYIMQDADCLHWENNQPFFESERGSYTIQMWWLYMKGTKQDLWNSVPPKMAQRVFGGMLNETLTVLTLRYTHMKPSAARSQLLLVDVCNILHCVSELLPYVAEQEEAYVGLQITNQSKIIRDIHAKCHELFCCLLLRGAPLLVLFKLLRKGTRTLDLFSSRQGLPSAWIVFTLPKLFPIHQSGHWATKCTEFPTSTILCLELKVLLAAPQPNWSFLMKVLLMRNATITSIILHHLLKNLPTIDNFKAAMKQPLYHENSSISCGAFLCSGECFNLTEVIAAESDPVGQTNYQIVLALTYIILCTGKSSDIHASLITALEEIHIPNWADCLDKIQVWNQKRPPWLEAILHFIYPVMNCIVNVLVNAMQTGASKYQSMSLAITCISEMWDCIPDGVYKISVLLADVLPVTTRPLGDSVLFQILFTALYTKLIETAEYEEKQSTQEGHESNASICFILSEAICSIDEDNKHTEQINSFLKQVRDSKNSQFFNGPANETNNHDDAANTEDAETGIKSSGAGGLSGISTIKIDDLEDGLHESPSTSSTYEFDVESTDCVSEVLASDVLTTEVGKQSLRICYNYLKNNKEWLFQQLGISDVEVSEFENLPGQKLQEEEQSLLKTMFYIGSNQFDQLLTGGLKIDYNSWLHTPISITPEQAWLQVSKRYEFQENSKISLQEAAPVALITKHLKNN